MKIFDLAHNFRLRTQMILFVCVVIAVMAVQGMYNLSATMKVIRDGEDLFKYNLNGVRYALEIKASYFAAANALNQHLNITNPTEYDAVEKTYAEQEEALGRTFASFEPLLTQEEEKRLFAEIKATVEDYLAHGHELIALDRAGKVAEAKATVVPQMRGARQVITSNLTALVDTHIAEAEAGNAQSRKVGETNRNNSIIGIILVAVIYFIMAYFIPTLIEQPLGDIQKVMDGLAAGDLTKKVPVKGRNELAALAKVVNRTIDGLRGLVSRVADTANQVAASSEELASSAEEVGQVTQQVATTIGQLAQGSDEQARAAQETGQVVDGMSASIQQVAASAQKMAHDADAAAKTAADGNKSVGQAISRMNSVRATVDRSAVAVKGLGERSQQIGAIVEVITGIADQTNLLALNAAIEAARAGEQGRGFAVVAEEVRKLAEQSRQAAEQISGLIQEIQNETQKAVSTMETGTTEVAAGAGVVEDTGRAFGAIAKAVETVVAQIQEVSAATQSLAAGSERVVKAVENIAAITEEAAAGAEEVSASSQQQTASVEEIAASAEGLSKLAAGLQGAVAAFRL